jgi:hypothetical protein
MSDKTNERLERWFDAGASIGEQQCAEKIAAAQAEVSRLQQALREATNGWACFAKRKIEHDEIARLHRIIAESASDPGGGSR